MDLNVEMFREGDEVSLAVLADRLAESGDAAAILKVLTAAQVVVAGVQQLNLYHALNAAGVSPHARNNILHAISRHFGDLVSWVYRAKDCPYKVAHLMMLTEKEIGECRGVGSKTIEEMRGFMERLGLWQDGIAAEKPARLSTKRSRTLLE